MGRWVHKQAKLEEIYALAAHSIAFPIELTSAAVTTFHLQLDAICNCARYAWRSSARSTSCCPTERIISACVRCQESCWPRQEIYIASRIIVSS
jgi:hypothetical protein